MIKILAINPFFDDFLCYLNYKYQPIGILKVLGYLKETGKVEYQFLDAHTSRRRKTKKPKSLEEMKGGYFRYGMSDEEFQLELERVNFSPDFLFITAGLTHRYPSYHRTIQLCRKEFERAKIVLGGTYPTLCPEHAENNEDVDFIVNGPGEEKAAKILGLSPPEREGFWDFDVLPEDKKDFAMLLTSYGCPRHCTHCATHRTYGKFRQREVKDVIAEVEDRYSKGVRDFYLYDDNLLENSNRHFEKWAEEMSNFPGIQFHIPNAICIDLVTERIAEMMKERLHIRNPVLGIDSLHEKECLDRWWISYSLIRRSIQAFVNVGYRRQDIKCYILVDNPNQTIESLLDTVKKLLDLGVKPVPTRYMPVPGVDFQPEKEELEKLSNKVTETTISRKQFSQLSSFIRAVSRLRQLGCDIINGKNEFEISLRSMIYPSFERLLSTSEIAEVFEVDDSTIRRWVYSGKLIPAAKRGNRYFFKYEEAALKIEKEV